MRLRGPANRPSVTTSTPIPVAITGKNGLKICWPISTRSLAPIPVPIEPKTERDRLVESLLRSGVFHENYIQKRDGGVPRSFASSPLSPAPPMMRGGGGWAGGVSGVLAPGTVGGGTCWLGALFRRRAAVLVDDACLRAVGETGTLRRP